MGVAGNLPRAELRRFGFIGSRTVLRSDHKRSIW